MATMGDGSCSRERSGGGGGGEGLSSIEYREYRANLYFNSHQITSELHQALTNPKPHARAEITGHFLIVCNDPSELCLLY